MGISKSENHLRFTRVSRKDTLLHHPPTGIEQTIRSNRFVYRGLSDSEYKLVPTAFRKHNDDSLGDDFLWRHKASIDNHPQINHRNYRCSPVAVAFRQAELKLVSEFYKHAERAGLPLPHLSEKNHRELITGKPGDLSGATLAGNMSFPGRIIRKDWPVTELIPIFALAQHYGLPTRLLDWSWSPLTAAYFAASSNIKGGKKLSKPRTFLSVWATVSEQLSVPINDEQGHPANLPQTHGKLFRVHPPSAANRNLHLQQGLFTFTLDRVSSGSDLKAEEISASIPQNEYCKQDTPEFFQILLPADKAPELLHVLRSIGVVRERIIEGFHGVVESVIESVDLTTSKWSQ